MDVDWVITPILGNPQNGNDEQLTGAKRREWGNGMMVNGCYRSFPHSRSEAPVRQHFEEFA